MKIKPTSWRFPAGRSRGGFLQIDLAMGLLILAIALVPLGDSFIRERRALRMEYDRSLANEIVDGEMEILAAGAAAGLPDGTRVYPVHSPAVAGLPAGHFQLTKNARHLRLEWIPDEPHHVSIVARETTLP